MSMLPRLFLYRTIIGRCWAGVVKLHLLEVSGFCGACMPKFLKKLLYSADCLTNSGKFMLFSLSPDNSSTKEDASRG
jgi:hypothetical protein